MANDCLVTKLKGVVDNPNLDYFDKVKFSIDVTNYTSGGQNIGIIKGANGAILPAGSIENLNTDGAVVQYDNSEGYLYIKKGSGNIISMFLPKYLVERIDFYLYEIQTKLSELSKFYNIKTLDTGTSAHDALTNITNFRVLEKLVMRNYAVDAVYDISLFAQVPSIKHLELNYCPSVQGDLSGIKDMPNLKKLILDHTLVSDTDDNVTYLRNRGVDVTYTYGS